MEGLISWDVEKTIRQALQDEPDPGTGSPDCCFVPSSAHSTVINWINTAKFACHPGVGKMVLLVGGPGKGCPLLFLLVLFQLLHYICSMTMSKLKKEWGRKLEKI